MFFRTNAVVFLAAMGAVGAIPTAFAHNSALEQHVNHGTDHAADTEVAIDVNTASSSFTQEPGDMEELTRIFSDADIVDGPSIVPCTLSGGTETNCFSITVKQTPSSYTPGPWCPGHINDTADTGGIWLEAGEVNDVDGKFIENLASFYDDEKFSLFDEATGKIRITDTYEKCEGAARPDVAEEYQQHCVECLPEYLSDDASVTYTIPLSPQNLGEQTYATQTAGSGLAFNGVRLDGSAPVDAILENYTIAPFDDCGGHINLNVGYHYHAATDCLNNSAIETSHGNIVGVAMDGHPLYARLNKAGELPTDLDSCGGHTVEGFGYHYHAGDAGSNQILSCLAAEVGCVSEDPTASCDASASKKGGGDRGAAGGGKPDFSQAAEQLGISEQELLEALGGPPPNFAAAAEKLGVSEETIEKAVGAVGK